MVNPISPIAFLHGSGRIGSAGEFCDFRDLLGPRVGRGHTHLAVGSSTLG